MGSRASGSVVLEVRGVRKRFPGVVAPDRVDLDVRASEAYVVLGENGAGKSTFMKILSGACRKDDGEILIDGQPVEIRDPWHAQELGIAIIYYQTFNQVPHLSVAENILLGRERTRLGLIDYEDLYHRDQQELDRIGPRVDLRTRVMDLGVAQRRMIEIAKALSLSARVVIMDEATSALTERETETLLGIIDSLRREHMGVIYISHRPEKVKRLGDRVTVLRDGKKIGTLPVEEADIPTMIRMMVGRDLTFTTIDRQSRGGPEMLRVEHLGRERVLRGISFSARRGEIVTLFGLVVMGDVFDTLD